MTPARFDQIASRYGTLRIAVLGDFCLDRYLEIDPARVEVSIETGLPVHNVVRVRAQPGAAGTVLNNLVALGVGTLFAIGFCGDDGEGYELKRALGALPGVHLDHFLTSDLRRTFTYCKPLLCGEGSLPQELSRLDSKNWDPTPASVSARICSALSELRSCVDAVIVMDQVDVAETGVVTSAVREALAEMPIEIPVVADSRRGLRGYPPVIYKMNAAELVALDGGSHRDPKEAALQLATRNQRPVFVTMAEKGIVAAGPDGEYAHRLALPLRGPIDVVGAGDSVTANITAALAAGASLDEAVAVAIAASSIVIHQVGTTGAATVSQIASLLTQ